jgi:hypothetical protein
MNQRRAFRILGLQQIGLTTDCESNYPTCAIREESCRHEYHRINQRLMIAQIMFQNEGSIGIAGNCAKLAKAENPLGNSIP